MRTLYLKVTTPRELKEKWLEGKDSVFILTYRLVQCNKLGKVNWNTASVYRDSEVIDLLIKGRPVVILK